MSAGAFAQDSLANLSADQYAVDVNKVVASTSESSAAKVRSRKGYATYYAKKFEGRKTTSGKRYRGKKMTAAHLSLPFGTVVTVTNLANGKSVDVVVNDRGPHSKKYIIDVSEGAAKELGFYRKGQSMVEISYQTQTD